jgi:hypothetical protein
MAGWKRGWGESTYTGGLGIRTNRSCLILTLTKGFDDRRISKGGGRSRFMLKLGRGENVSSFTFLKGFGGIGAMLWPGKLRIVFVMVLKLSCTFLSEETLRSNSGKGSLTLELLLPRASCFGTIFRRCSTGSFLGISYPLLRRNTTAFDSASPSSGAGMLSWGAAFVVASPETTLFFLLAFTVSDKMLEPSLLHCS